MNAHEIQFRQLVDGLTVDVQPRAGHREQLRGRMLAVYAESSGRTNGIGQVWSLIMTSKALQGAIAAAVVLGILLSWMALADKKEGQTVAESGPERPLVVPEDQQRVQSEAQAAAELALAGRLFAASDVKGLAALFDSGRAQTKLAVVNYLAKLGTPEAIEALKTLNVADAEASVQKAVQQALQDIEARQDAAEKTAGDAEQPTQDGPASNTGFETAQDAEAVVSDADNEREGFVGIKITETGTGQPIAGAHVRVRSNLKQVNDLELKTDAAGRVLLEIGTEKVDYLTVSVKAEGFVGKYIEWRPDSKGIEVPRQYFAQMKKSVSIGGVVKTKDGQPLENAEVEIGINFGSPETDFDYFHATVTTDKDGRWEFDGFDPDAVSPFVWLKHEAYVETESYGTRPDLGQLLDKSCTFFMVPGFSVSGHVRRTDGTPIVGALVYRGFSRYGSEKPAKTDSQGFYIFSKCRREKMVLTVMAEGYGPELQVFMVEKSVRDMDFVLETGHQLKLRIIDRDGKPVEGVKIEANYWRPYNDSQDCQSIRASARTNKDGRAVLKDLPADAVQYTISKDGFAGLGDIGLLPSEDEQVLELWPRGKLKGKVYDAQSRQLIRQFRMIEGIHHSGQSKPVWQDEYGVKHFDSGQYELVFTNHAPQGYAVKIEADGYLPFESQTYYNEGTEAVLDVHLNKGPALLAGTVYDPNGVPAVGADVLISTKGGYLVIANGRLRETSGVRVKTDGRGQFAAVPKQPDFALVVLHDSGFAQVSQEAFRSAGEIRLQKWGRIEGTVYEGRTPAVNSQVELHPPLKGGPTEFRVIHRLEAVTDEQGRFSIDRAVPGRMTIYKMVRVADGARGEKRGDVEVRAGETTVIHLGGGGQTVKGRFVAPEGLEVDFTENRFELAADPGDRAPVPAAAAEGLPIDFFLLTHERPAIVTAWRQTPEGKSYANAPGKCEYAVAVDHEGYFAIADIPPGRYIGRGTFRDFRRKPQGRMTTVDYDYYGTTIAQVEFEFTVEEPVGEEVFEKPLEVGCFTLKKANHLEIGQAAPDVAMKDLEGRRWTLQDFAGKHVLLDLAGYLLLGDLDSDHVVRMKEIHRTWGQHLEIISISAVRGDFPAGWMSAALQYAHEKKQVAWLFVFEDLPPSVPSRFDSDYAAGGRTASYVLIGPDGRVLEMLFDINEVAGAVEKHLGTDLAQ